LKEAKALAYKFLDCSYFNNDKSYLHSQRNKDKDFSLDNSKTNSPKAGKKIKIGKDDLIKAASQMSGSVDHQE